MSRKLLIYYGTPADDGVVRPRPPNEILVLPEFTAADLI